MRAIDKNEKKVFYAFSAVMILCELFFLLQYFSVITLLDMMLTVQLILLFVRRCPTWLYIGVAAVWIGFGFYNIYQIIASEHVVFFSYMDMTFRWGITLSLIVISALLVVIKLVHNRAIAVTIFALELLYLVSFYGYRISVGIEIFNFNRFSDIVQLVYKIGMFIGYVLMLVVVFRSRQCSCGYVRHSKAKFCGGCGKAFELK